jgi:hypothetical protein
MESRAARAAEQFEAARRRAFVSEIVAFLSGQTNELLSWEEVRDKLHVRGQQYRGIQSVPVEKIVGSVGRYQDFDRAFLPRQDAIAGRWMAIASARSGAVGLPPVKLYQVGDAYFVLDGHHRVSVAREQGGQFIDAEVIEAEARVPVTSDLRAQDLGLKAEYTRFLELTRLDKLRPEQQIEFTIPGGYDRLLEHVAVHRYFMGLERERFVPEDEAVCDWYDNVYMPLVRIIREQDVLADFPHRTEADLYLWVIDHQHYLRERFGPGVETERATEHFVDHYTTRFIRRILHAVRDMVSGEDMEKEFD